MTSPAYQPGPDVTAYTDLRIFDRTDQEIVEQGLALLTLNVPEWTPREHQIEVMLLESLALEISEGIVAVNRIPGAVLETLLRFIGLRKSYGNPPTATATVVLADTMGHSIPAGTRVAVPANDGSVIVMLVQPPGLDVPNGSASGTVGLVGETFTASANGVPAGTGAALVSPLPFIDSIVLTTPVVDGLDAESDDEWRDRGVKRLSRLTDALMLPKHFYAAAMENPNVTRAVVVDNTDPSVAGTGNTPGHVTVAVLGAGGSPLSAAQRTALQADLQELAFAPLAVHVVDITVTTLTIAVSVHLADATDPDAIIANVRQAIIVYLDPLEWSGGTTIRRNELISLVDQVAGVDYVNSVTITGANGNGDFVLPTASAVPRATAASVTVTVA